MRGNECRFDCPNCATEQISPVPGEKECANPDCPYSFRVFSKRDRDKARSAYLLLPSKSPKYLRQAPDDRWFVGFTQKAQPFLADTLCDLIPALVLQTILEGLAIRLKTPSSILVRFNKDPEADLRAVRFIEEQGYTFGWIDHLQEPSCFAKRCSKIWEADGGQRCLRFGTELTTKMIESTDPRQREAQWYPCWSGLVDCVAPIVINNVVVAGMFAGQIRWTDPEGEEHFRKGTLKVAEALGISEAKALAMAEDASPRKMSKCEIDDFVQEFRIQANMIKELAASRYWAERRVADYGFLSEVFASFAAFDPAVDDEDALWKLVGAVLTRINEFSLFAGSAFFFRPDEQAGAFVLKASAGCVEASKSTLELTTQQTATLFRKESLCCIREAGETKDAVLCRSILPFLSGRDPNCALLFPFVLGQSRQGLILLAERTTVAGRPIRGEVSSEDQDFLEKLVHEIKMEVQNALQIRDLRKGLQERADLMATTGHLLVAPLDAAYGKTERLKFLVEKKEGPGIAANASRIAQLCDELDKDIVYCVRRTRSFMFFATMGTSAEVYRFNREISLARILRECKQDFEHLASNRGISITFEPQGEIPVAPFDGEKLQIAFSNLLDNAVKYSDANRVIRIKLGYDKTAEVYTASVDDFGVGIPKKELEAVFLPYRRSKLWDPRRFIPGTGIGLSVVKQIISRHGGRVWITSGQGALPSGARTDSSLVEGFNTTFWIQLHKRRKQIQ